MDKVRRVGRNYWRILYKRKVSGKIFVKVIGEASRKVAKQEFKAWLDGKGKKTAYAELARAIYI